MAMTLLPPSLNRNADKRPRQPWWVRRIESNTQYQPYVPNITPRRLAVNSERRCSRSSEILQGEFQSAILRVLIHCQGICDIQLVTGHERISFHAFCHSPSHGFIVETVLLAIQFLIYPDFDVLFLDELWRYQQTYSAGREYRLAISLSEWLKRAKVVQ